MDTAFFCRAANDSPTFGIVLQLMNTGTEKKNFEKYPKEDPEKRYHRLQLANSNLMTTKLS
jgi:hypothetical protein